MPQNSYMHPPHQAAITRRWHHIDAKGLVLGRIATKAADLLRGKGKVTYTDYVDCGDFVVVLNVDKVKMTGRKLDQKTYYWHTGYPGGIKERTADKILNGKFPERILEKAVERMLPKESPLARKQLTHLRIYNAGEHPHEAQAPEVIAFGAMNSKNVRSK